MVRRKNAVRVQPARYTLGGGVFLRHCRAVHSKRTLVQESFASLVVLSIS